MAQWKRVLLSGSHFTVRELTISEISAAQDGDTILFAGSASSADSGSFKTKDLYEIVNGGDLSGSFGSNTGNETSFEGDGSSIVNVTADYTAESLKPGAGLGIIRSTGADVAFDGQLGHTMVVLLKGTGAQGGPTNYPGTIFNSSDASAAQSLANNLNAGVNSGLLFYTGSGQIQLGVDYGLPGNGLEWELEDGNVGEQLRINLHGGNNSTSGLNLHSTEGLRISTNFDGDGLSLTDGVLDLDLTTNSGLTVSDALMTSGKLALAAGLAGTGLLFPAANDRSALSVDVTYAATSSTTIDFEPQAPSNGGIWTNTIGQGQGNASNLYGVIAASTNNIISDIEYSTGGSGNPQDLINNPSIYFELSKTWGNSVAPANADFTITGNVTIKGDLTILSSSNISNLQVNTFATDDQFIVLNSGSQGSGPFQYYNGGIIVNTHDTNGQMSGSALFYQSGSDSTIWGVTTEGQVAWDDINPGITDGGISNSTTVAAISTVTYATGDDPNTLQDTNPEYLGYDWTKQERRGTWYVDENSGGLGAESNVWLYVAEQGDSGGGGGKGV